MAEQTDTESLAGKDRWQPAIQLSFGDVCLLSFAVSLIPLVLLVLITTFTGIWQFSVLWPIFPVTMVGLHYYSKRRLKARWTLHERFAVLLIGPAAISAPSASRASEMPPGPEAQPSGSNADPETKPSGTGFVGENSLDPEKIRNLMRHVEVYLTVSVAGTVGGSCDEAEAREDGMLMLAYFSDISKVHASMIIDKLFSDLSTGTGLLLLGNGKVLLKQRAKVLEQEPDTVVRPRTTSLNQT